MISKEWVHPKWYQKVVRHIFVALLPTIILFALQHWLWFIACTIVKSYPDNILLKPWTPLDEFHVTAANSWFVIFYGLSFAWWLIIPIIIYNVYGKKLYYRYIWTLTIMYLVGFVIFLVIPTSSSELYANDKASITGNDFFSRFIKDNMRSHNSGVCAIPSFHVIGTYSIWLVQRSSLSKKYEIKIDRKGNIIFFTISSFFTLMVSLSIFMIHQHYFVDFPTAVVVCEIVYWIVTKLEKRPNPMQKLFTNFNVGLLFEQNQNVSWGGTWSNKIQKAKYYKLWYVLIIILFLLICIGLIYSFSIGL